jgi:N-acetylneuraminate synthase
MKKIIAEIGINANGDTEIAKKLIDWAVISGCDYVKFQKRTPEMCVPEDQKDTPKKTPWGEMTYLEYKKKIEFNKKDYSQIDEYCKGKIKWFASVWDVISCNFMRNFCTVGKIPSCLITDVELCMFARNCFETLIISTGMSSEKQIENCIKVCNPDIILHTISAYPSHVSELNLNYILHLKDKYPNKKIGYSGHEFGLTTTFAAATLGAEYIERHITLDRTMWGSDQMASVEPHGLIKLVKGIRDIELSLGKGGDRKILESEKIKLKHLRG